MTLKCYYCGTKFPYKDLMFVLRIPEQNKFAPVCRKCVEGGSKATSIEYHQKSPTNGKKIKQENLLIIP